MPEALVDMNARRALELSSWTVLQKVIVLTAEATCAHTCSVPLKQSEAMLGHVMPDDTQL